MNLRFKIEAILVILLGILLVLAHYYYNAYQSEKTQKENVEKLFSKKQAEIELFKNRNGQLIAKNEQVQLENSTIKQLVKDGNLPWLKNFDVLKKNYSNLETAFQVQSKVLDSLKLKINYHNIIYVDKKGDSIKFQAFDIPYKDKWSDIKISQLSPDSVYVKYSVNVPLEGISYWHRKWFLGKKHYEVQVTSENPHVQIEKLLYIKETKKK